MVFLYLKSPNKCEKVLPFRVPLRELRASLPEATGVPMDRQKFPPRSRIHASQGPQTQESESEDSEPVYKFIPVLPCHSRYAFARANDKLSLSFLYRADGNRIGRRFLLQNNEADYAQYVSVHRCSARSLLVTWQAIPRIICTFCRSLECLLRMARR